MEKSNWYIQAPFGNGIETILFGHTTNPWLAKQFYKGLTQNKFFLESYETPREAIDNIDMFYHHGTITSFYYEVKDKFDMAITGSDILDVFYTGMMGDEMEVVPRKSVITTLTEVTDGSFMEFAERFLLPIDIMGTRNAMGFLTLITTFMVDDFLNNDQIRIIISLFRVINNHPLFSENKPPFLQDLIFTNEPVFDMIQYGLLKGWYCPI